MFVHFFSDSEFHGSPLIIPNVQPEDLGAYLCVAKNGVPPSSSKRVFLYVQCKPSSCYYLFGQYLHSQISTFFTDPPKIVSHQNVIGIAFGSDVRVDCKVTAYPAPIIFWTFRGDISLKKNQLLHHRL